MQKRICCSFDVGGDLRNVFSFVELERKKKLHKRVYFVVNEIRALCLSEEVGVRHVSGRLNGYLDVLTP